MGSSQGNTSEWLGLSPRTGGEKGCGASWVSGGGKRKSFTNLCVNGLE